MWFKRQSSRAVAAAVLGLSSSVFGAGTVIHVDDDAVPGGDGGNWDTAYRFLQDALLNASVGDRIWVAEGVYYPDQGAEQTQGDISATFQLVDFVSILGGFVGDESEEDERNPDRNETVLSGDIGIPGNDSDNSTRVVLVTSVHDATVLDGFTITGGRAESDGGGMRIVFGSGDPTVINCHFIDNQAGDDGGAVFSIGQPTFVDCTFLDNSSGHQGGAVWCSTSSFVGCVFEGNDSQEGGAVFIDGDATSFIQCSFINNAAAVDGGGVSTAYDLNFEGCIFLNNTTFGSGGGIHGFGALQSDTNVIDSAFIGNTAGDRAGGIANTQGGTSKYYGCRFIGNVGTFGGGLTDAGNTAIVNCLFSGNTSSVFGGGFTNDFGTVVVVDSTFSANSTMEAGGGIHVRAGDIAVTNCILWGNDVNGVQGKAAQLISPEPIALDYSCIQGLTGQYGGTGNIGDDPLFVDLDGVDNILGTDDDDARLQSGSPCIDAGNNWGVPIDENDYDEDGRLCELFPVDLDGNPRFNADEADLDPGCGVPVVVDMGAYEYQFDPADQVTFADLNGDNAVGAADLLGLLVSWGTCGKGCCLADLDIDGNVGASDLLALLANWGPCP